MLVGQHGVESPGFGQVAQVRGAFGPDQPILSAGLMGGHGDRADGPHARAVGAGPGNLSFAEQFHRLGGGGTPARRGPIEHGGDKPLPVGKRLIVTVGVAGVKQHDVSRPQWAMFLLPVQHHLGHDQKAFAGGGVVDVIAQVDHAGFAHESPDRHLIAGDFAHRPGARQAGIGGWHEMGWGVELRAGVLVDHHHVAIVGPGANRARRGQLIGRHPGRPDAGQPRRDQQRQIDHARSGRRFRRR